MERLKSKFTGIIDQRIKKRSTLCCLSIGIGS